MQRHFYATADDLLPIFERVERKHDLSYTLTELLYSPVLTQVRLGALLPSLRSPAPYRNAVAGPQYLVTPAEAAVHVRDVPQRSGGVRYAVDQLINPDSIIVQHGGFFRPDVLLYGRVGTVSDTDFSRRVYRAFSSAIAKQFVRVRSFYVGPQAHALLGQGCRLTIGEDSPVEYDLAP